MLSAFENAALEINDFSDQAGCRPGANFTNILHKTFTLIDPKSIKNTFKSSVSFYAFGDMRA